MSAFFPSGYFAGPLEGKFVPEESTNQKDLMLIDLALWEILNRTKRNDELIEKLSATDNNDLSIPDPELYSVVGAVVIEPVFDKVAHDYAINVFSTDNPRFTHSGPSPPQLV